MRRILFSGLFAFFVLAELNASPVCAKVEDNDRRLACYDAEYRPSTRSEIESSWNVSESVSPIDDSKEIVLRTESTEAVRSRFGRADKIRLYIRCSENTTAMFINFSGHHMSDHGSYGEVTMRVDSKPAFTVEMAESTDHKALGVWRGSASISYIKLLFGGQMLTVRATPYSESPITAQFPISGLESAIQPLRETCGW